MAGRPAVPAAVALAATAVLVVACTSSPTSEPGVATAGGGGSADAGDAETVLYLPWEEALARLDTETVEWITAFAETVPGELPEHALPQVHFIDPPSFETGSAHSDFVVPLADGMLQAQFVLGNPSTRRNKVETILCLRNHEQTPCGAGADTWDVALPGMTMAFFPLRLRAEAGDRLSVLLIPTEQPGYPFPWATLFTMFAERRPPAATASVEAPPHERVWPWEGCGFARVLMDPPPIESHRMPVAVTRDAELFLLLERCEEDETLRLLAIGDRRDVVPVPGVLWSSTLRMAGRTALIPIDPAWFNGVSELQIVVLREEYGSGRGLSAWFSDAVGFSQ